MRGRKKVPKKEGESEEVDGYRDPDAKTLIDFGWVCYIGMQCGYTEKEVSQMYYSKWLTVYEMFKRHHNMIIQKKVYQGA